MHMVQVLQNVKQERIEYNKVIELKKLKSQMVFEKVEINTTVQKSISNSNPVECKYVKWIFNKQDLLKFDMILLQQIHERMKQAKSKQRTTSELEILRPWQNKLMISFLAKLFKESQHEYLLKSTVVRKYNEAGVPFIQPRIAQHKTYYEKKNNYPPWALSQKVEIWLPFLDQESFLKRVESQISLIIQAKIDRLLEKFKLPIMQVDIQKDYNLQLQILDPPLHVVTRCLKVDMDTFFNKVLEIRGNIRNEVARYLCEKYIEKDWAKILLIKIQDVDLNLIMLQSHQSLIIRESIIRDLDKNIVINTICEPGQLYGYLAAKYLNSIKNNEVFDKIITECYIKYGYKLIKIGSGTFIICPNKYISINSDQNPEVNKKCTDESNKEAKYFEYKMVHCSLCNEEQPNSQILEQMLNSAYRVIGENETLTYYENERILIVNNYASLALSLKKMSEQASLGVDLEGRLRVGGYINLIQIACEDAIFIFDIHQITSIQNDKNLLQLTIQVLKCIFLNPSIRKVFFDGKRDLEALHFIIGVGIRNFYDAQAIHMTLFQLMEMHKNQKLFELKYVATPGLNDVLSKYKVSHGLNSLKEQFKKLFDNRIDSKKYLYARPIDPDFASYSAQDVENLSELADIIDVKLGEVLDKNVDPNFRKKLVTQLSNTYTSQSCGQQIEIEQKQNGPK
ncbi:UNKNOWN [Stylonychia lemnae]|uniref:3'-5' exonuclease domain-containing protein n=1 Tax=Stylonychia lemnae TaxID=5949 RepID=A0A077ZTH1_STYLE|nr:UNKNOWN [Stylonychia lemnae]|eukprot:CDW72630.1 UNKNOWN [Stylonychia lemnae]